MRAIVQTAIAAVTLAAAGAASADVTFYQHENFSGRSFTTRVTVLNFQEFANFNDRASSVVVSEEPWEVCDDQTFRGRCFVLRPGEYPSLRAMGLNNRISSARPLDRRAHFPEDRYAPLPPTAQITFYDGENFSGRTFTSGSDVPVFYDVGFNDMASSIVVTHGRWEACDDSRYRGRCIVLRPGSYPTLRGTGLDNRVSSARLVAAGTMVEESRYAPLPVTAPQWRPAPQETLYQANVVSSRAVYGQGAQQCWVTHDEVNADQRRDNRLGGAVIGGLLGGIIGHQIGGSNPQTGTVVGALGGAAVGAAIGNNVKIGGQDVQHCGPGQAQGSPIYWDNTYVWRGVEHHVQTQGAPGTSIPVNDTGEPRVQQAS